MSSGKTREIAINRVWTQISSGEDDTTVQFYTQVNVCRSDEQPNEGDPWLSFGICLLTFSSTDKVWVRTAFTDSSVVTVW